jgi:hypothetical protein
VWRQREQERDGRHEQPLPFNGKGDVTTGDVQIWCVPPAPSGDPDVGGPAIDSGLYFDSAPAP